MLNNGFGFVKGGSEVQPAALYSGIFAVRLLVYPPASHERKLMLTILILGPLYEIVLIHAGLHVYQHGVVFGIPLWLIIYWMFIVRVIKAVADRLEHLTAGTKIP